MWHAQVNDFSTEEKKKHSKDHNVACLATFVDVLVGLACDQWKENNKSRYEVSAKPSRKRRA